MTRAAIVAIALALTLSACGEESDRVPVPGHDGATKSSASARAARRAYDGAPPVIPHVDFNADCTSCHNEQGIEVPDLGFAPPMPHALTPGLSANCRQCHVWQVTDALFVTNSFVGVPQTFAGGDRAHETAPPVIPHRLFMRENCLVCHSGPAAREEIRCTHPERANCAQCHVPAVTAGEFRR